MGSFAFRRCRFQFVPDDRLQCSHKWRTYVILVVIIDDLELRIDYPQVACEGRPNNEEHAHES